MRFPQRREHSLAPIVVRFGNIFLPRGITVNIEAASPRSRLARTLVTAFLTSPGRALSPDALVAEAWPKFPPDPMSRGKLKVTICRLRAAGLPILTLRAGYAIDPRAIIVVADELEPERPMGVAPELEEMDGVREDVRTAGEDRFDPSMMPWG